MPVVDPARDVIYSWPSEKEKEELRAKNAAERLRIEESIKERQKERRIARRKKK